MDNFTDVVKKVYEWQQLCSTSENMLVGSRPWFYKTAELKKNTADAVAELIDLVPLDQKITELRAKKLTDSFDRANPVYGGQLELDIMYSAKKSLTQRYRSRLQFYVDDLSNKKGRTGACLQTEADNLNVAKKDCEL